MSHADGSQRARQPNQPARPRDAAAFFGVPRVTRVLTRWRQVYEVYNKSRTEAFNKLAGAFRLLLLGQPPFLEALICAENGGCIRRPDTHTRWRAGLAALQERLPIFSDFESSQVNIT